MKNSTKVFIEERGFKLPESGIYTFLNPFSYLKIRSSINLKEFDGVYVDGISLIIMLRLYGLNLKRNSFDMTSLAPKVFKQCIRQQLNIFFIGSTENYINTYIDVIKKEFPHLEIIGFRNGYFQANEKQITINKIIDTKPDVVVVGMGSPLQELFLIDLKKNGFQGVAYTCGGFIHQTAKGINYYPEFFNKYNLRWLYRILDEPKLLKRYFIEYPKALFYMIKDFKKK